MSDALDQNRAAAGARRGNAQRRPYRIVSSDQHVNEPPTLWLDRVPARFKDIAPRQQSFDKGDGWVLDGVADPLSFGMTACAGKAPEDMGQWARWETVRKGGYIGSERLREMAATGSTPR